MTSVQLGLPVVPGSPVGAAIDTAGRPDDARLVDRYGRVAVDLRVSLTDRCNLRCDYCMPEEGLDWLKRDAVLTADEIVRLITIAVRDLGVEEVRFTGGEPLLRRDFEDVLRGITAPVPPSPAPASPDGPPSAPAPVRRPRTSATTNGLDLAKRAAPLRAAGLDRVNVSLDTLRRDTFRELTRRDRFDDVLAGLDAARAAGFEPIKLNAVLLRGRNDDEAADLLRFCVDNGYELRFIEQMPLDAQHGWDRARMVTAAEILELLRASFDLTPDPAERGAAPAERWLVDGGPATVGVIASVTRPFCQACDRTRLTADGQLRTCLFATSETDLRSLLRGGASDREIGELWRAAMWGKAAGHGIDSAGFAQPDRPMSAIGG